MDNDFGIIVLNEANRELQEMMHEEQVEIQEEWKPSDTALADHPVGTPRPMQPPLKGDVETMISKVRSEGLT